MLKIATVPTTAFAQNTRIIADEDKHTAVVSDPGGYAADMYKILITHELTLKAIILTHGHLDHVGGVAELSRLTGAKIIGPSNEDFFLIESLDSQAELFGLSSSGNFTPSYVKDNDVLKLFDDYEFKVITTPGHTPGGVCYYCEKAGFLLAGDSLFAGSIGRCDFPRSSMEDLISSLKEKILTLPDDTKVLSGHGPDTTIGREKAENPYLNGEFY